MKIAAIGFTEKGCALACKLRDALADLGHTVDVSGPERFAKSLCIAAYESLDAWTRSFFGQVDALLFVSATGIAVRAIAPYVRDKFTDPAVVSVDEAGHFAVPLLSGHVGGANDLARSVAAACGGQAVVSTATDVNGLFAVDEWARKHNLAILDRPIAKEVAAALLAGQPVGFTSDWPVTGPLPPGLHETGDRSFVSVSHCIRSESSQSSFDSLLESPLSKLPDPGILNSVGISISFDPNKRPFLHTLRLAPRIITIGVGCKRGTPASSIAKLVDACLKETRIIPAAVTTVASIDVKADEPGLCEFAKERGWELRFYTARELAAVPGEFTASDFVAKTVGVDNVCERSACAAAGTGSTLIQRRRSLNGVTVALAASLPTLAFE